jgi:uncharacterized protein (DUF1501 family)
MSSIHNKNGMDRRKFIANTGCAALGFTTMLSSLVNMKAIAAAALDKSAPQGGSNDYKGLVCLLLSGGADSHNMLVPRTGESYNNYLTTRSNLAIPQSAILPLNFQDNLGLQYGVHPAMPEVRQLFNEGHLSFIANVGTLVEPITKAQYLNNNKKVPLGLYSHSDQIKHWQTGRPGERARHGWAGRMADLMAAQNTNPGMSMNISLSGTNQLQQGATTTEYAVNHSEAFGIRGYGLNHHYHTPRTAAIDNILDAQYADVFESTYINTVKNAVSQDQQMKQALETSPSFNNIFSDTPTSQRFRTVARIIAARERLNANKQTFFINFGGWDHHEEVMDAQGEKLPEFSKALGEFYQALVQMGLHQDVTTFTISDFGRTLTSNGNGSDHAWGGNTMVMGGSVNGGQIFGQYPSLEMGSEWFLDRGVMIPTTSAAEYMSELALWYGVSPGDLTDIFPDLPNFWSPQSGSYPLGFMNPQGQS